MIRHQREGIFRDLPSPFEATRYHSLIVAEDSLPDCLAVTARACSEDGLADEIMGIQHARLSVTGVQFHPEAILTRHGHHLLANFLDPVREQAVGASKLAPTSELIESDPI